MKIGTVIKQARREKDMTQEQLAECLHVSVAAVSQWETGKTMPDLGAIPALCHLFGITADQLLGIDLEKQDEQIKSIREEATACYTRGYFEEARRILSEGLRQYPNQYAMMMDLLFVCSNLAGKDAQSPFQEEAIRLGERILEGCTEDQLRHKAIQYLCIAYCNQGETEKAVALARTMPDITACAESLFVLAQKGTKRYQSQQKYADRLLQCLCTAVAYMDYELDDGKRPYTAGEQAALREKQIALLHLLLEDGDFGFYHWHLLDSHASLARYYAERKDAEQSLTHLRSAAGHAIGFIEYERSGGITHTSLVFRGLEHAGFSTGSPDNPASMVLRVMKGADFDCIRGDERFQEIEAELNKYAGKWERAKKE